MNLFEIKIGGDAAQVWADNMNNRFGSQLHRSKQEEEPKC